MKRLTMLAAVPLLALLAAGCGSQDKQLTVASAGGKPTKSAEEQTANLKDKQRKFAQCMRDHGVDMSEGMVFGGAAGGTAAKGGVRIGGGGGQGAAKPVQANPKLEKALEACRKYAPSGDDFPKPKPEELAKMRAFAKCMREHGVNMPDPNPNGNGAAIELGRSPADAKKLQAADKACRSLAPQGGGGAAVGSAR